FSVIGAVNQRFQPVPQVTFTITSGEINGVFHRHICDYDSVSGVFVWPNPDPLGEKGGINLYRFNYNSPLYYIDPDGLTPRGTAWGAAAGFSIGAALGGTIGGAG